MGCGGAFARFAKRFAKGFAKRIREPAGPRGAALASAVLLAAALSGCGGGHGAATHTDGGDARLDAADGAASGHDAPAEAPPAATCSHDGSAKAAAGLQCGCDADCNSGHCVDGVCCTTACAEACKTCAGAGSAGTCTFLVSGTKPRDATACATSDPSTCGFDGLCDGAGACRRHVSGTVCKAGACSGDAVVGSFACDGAGRCVPGPTTICAPFSCDATTGACFDACAQTSDCVAGQQCVNGSCGKKMKGASCNVNADCASGFCADRVCCNVACTGACVSCALTGRVGTCWPTNQGAPDPRGACQDLGPASCGTTGTCDGFGACEKYAPETQCLAPSCTGTRRNTPGTCDGNGTCRPQGVQNCSPFLCAAGACQTSCLSDSECEAGHACVNGLCGPKNLGQPCAGNTECVSNLCVEGVCCDGLCDGGCRSCALPSSMGHCTPLAANAVDTKGVCSDEGATTCGTNGKCDGNGACQQYKEGTVCAPESCSGNVYTPASTCSAMGQCTPPDSLPCAPYVCNGSACFNACAADQNCVTPNVCNGSSCGPKMRGASCSDPSECASSFCAQGVCCDTACAGACTSCALTGSRGTCTNEVAGDPDQAGLCGDQGGASCGTNGKCDGAGGCQRYKQGTPCADSTCPGGTTLFTPGSTCDGAGACTTPPASSCFPFECGSAVCKATCAADADCASPAVCIGGSCGLKGFGKTCADGTECVSGFCAQGVCCDKACSGTCQSCALPAALGTCGNVPDGGKDPQSRCADKGTAACGTDGACDGAGACRLYAAGTACQAASCTTGASTLTLVRTCDGLGVCKAATTQSCAPYLCNGVSACKAACTVDADCLLPNICDPQTNLCGNKRRLGQTCAATSDCLTGASCVDGVCCGSSACGLCQTCATGTCADVASGKPEPHGGCAAGPPCGNTGNCNGAGVCEQAGVGIACGAASCAGATFTSVSHCTGAGACATAATSPCSPYMCGAASCKTTCSADADCVAPFTCQGAGATRSCALKANGLACAGGTECITGNCVDGVCCGSSSCPACQACNLSGTGACAPVAAGTAAPATFCLTQAPSTCGTDGKCDGASGCQKYVNGTSCSAATCPALSSTLTLAGTCNGLGTCGAGTQPCGAYLCNGAAACRTTCASDADCVTATSYCTSLGACAPKLALGTACTATDQCGSGNCTDGVCCDSGPCAACKACNVGGSAGTCTPVAAGTTAPPTFCATQLASTCGTNGKCDGNAGCQKWPNGTGCSAASCPSMSSMLTLAGTCNGLGTCGAGTQSCGAFKCDGATSCLTTCTTDNDCAGTFYCAAGACVAKLALAKTCTATDQCGSGNCTDGVCCDSGPCAPCKACNVTGTGTCAPVAAGTTAPPTFCATQLASTCGTDGKCDGNAGCQKWPNGTGCSAASCPSLSSTLTLAGTCNGLGTCGAGTQSCGVFKCDGASSCLATCVTDNDCSGGNYCAGGSCVPQIAQGQPCTAGTQCGTSFCVDGVCCGTAGCLACNACNLNGAGTCSAVAQGAPDPHAGCVAATCGNDGVCDGTGACEQVAAGTTCAPAACLGGTTIVEESDCTAGACPAAVTLDCSPYKCDGTTGCLAKCNGDGDCASGSYCSAPVNGTCLGQGDVSGACSADDQCKNGQCVDGFCCGTPTTCGGCKSCGVAHHEGTCWAVAAGTPAGTFCTAADPSTCLDDGTCDGDGGCEKYIAGSVCLAAACTPGTSTLTSASTCDGLGTCLAGTMSMCDPYGCLADGTGCAAAPCGGDGDCASGATCQMDLTCGP